MSSSSNFQTALSGENGPAFPGIDDLKELDLLERMSDPNRRKGIYGHIIDEKLRYTNAASVALKQSPDLARDLGGVGTPQVMALAAYMQKLQTSDQAEAIIRKYLPAPRDSVLKALGSSISSSAAASSSGP